MRRATTLVLGAALAGLLLLAPAAEAKGLRMTLEATGEQLLHEAQQAAGVDPDHDVVRLVLSMLACLPVCLPVCQVGRVRIWAEAFWRQARPGGRSPHGPDPPTA